MVEEVRLAVADIRIVDRLVNAHGVDFHPLAILPVLALLRDLTDVDLRVEVGGKGLAVVSGVAVHDVEVVHLVKVVLGSIGGVGLGHARVKATAEEGHDAFLLKALVVSPLPAILKLGFVLRLVVGSIHVVGPCLKAGIHDGQILIGKGHVDDQIRFEAIDKCHGLGNIVCIEGCGLHPVAAYFGSDRIALRLRAAGEHDFRKGVGQ